MPKKKLSKKTERTALRRRAILKRRGPEHKMKLAIICGGPSAERGISLNSARSLFDNLDSEKYELTLLYVNPKLKFSKISETEIYSNTPLDFDYKLKQSKKTLTKAALKKLLKKTDLVFPAIHGAFGEDGQLQTMLEKWNVQYLGSSPRACLNTANKHFCQEVLKKYGFFTLKDYVAKKGGKIPILPKGNWVAKPLHGGSSIGVQYIHNPKELKIKLKEVFKHENQAIIEPKVHGTEFTIILLENGKGNAVALMPTEIEMHNDRFFDYRKKYLPTSETRYHTPARFDEKTTEKIRSQAAHAFKCLGMNDFGRLDGWILEDGTIWFSDVNAISGMEQNSFLFQQAALLGLSHSQLLDYIINKKINRSVRAADQNREEIPVIFGGNTAERQVSVMSGTNVWMKLKQSKKYKPVPLFLSLDQKIYYIPQFLCLQHTVEEIEEKIHLLKNSNYFDKIITENQKILQELGIDKNSTREPLFTPRQTSIESISKDYHFLFLGLHGGVGENGRFQTMLDRLKLPYNGPGADCSVLCMDKFATGQRIEQAKIPGVSVAKKYLMPIHEDPDKTWKKLKELEFSESIILKPRADGCSAGVIRINNLAEFKKTVQFFRSGNPCIPERAIHKFHGQINLPDKKLDEILIEDFIITDKVTLENLKIHWQHRSDFIEITVGFLGEKNKLTVMSPSQTIANMETLSLEEKFMGGTGINLVPPPRQFVKSIVLKKVRERLKLVGQILGIEGYSRMDCFMNRKTGELIIIEANTLPALTPSTTFFQQAATLPNPLNPRQLLEKIIEIGKTRF